jgi:hypothetical protein
MNCESFESGGEGEMGSKLGAKGDFRPFRWDLSKREQLPKTSELAVPPEHRTQKCWLEFSLELRRCASRVIASAGDTDWIFVGRSPEHLFDYLSGVFAGIPHTPSLTLLLLSNRGLWNSPHRAARENPEAFAALSRYFAAERLDPSAIASRAKAVTFIDVVFSGSTFGDLVGYLRLWNKQHQGDWNAVQRRLRFVGLTKRGKTSPKTWRWHQHQDWLALVPDATVKNVSVPEWAWEMMGGELPKLTPSHTIHRWTLLRGGGAPRHPELLAAVQLARWLYELGRSREERRALAAVIAKQRDMRDPWLRTIVLQLRQKTKST